MPGSWRGDDSYHPEIPGEFGTRVARSDKSAIEAAIGALKSALEGGDTETIGARTNDLVQASMSSAKRCIRPRRGPGAEGGACRDKGRCHRADFKEVSPDDKEIVTERGGPRDRCL